MMVSLCGTEKIRSACALLEAPVNPLLIVRRRYLQPPPRRRRVLFGRIEHAGRIARERLPTFFRQHAFGSDLYFTRAAIPRGFCKSASHKRARLLCKFFVLRISGLKKSGTGLIFRCPFMGKYNFRGRFSEAVTYALCAKLF